jgi:hypothetical protein
MAVAALALAGCGGGGDATRNGPTGGDVGLMAALGKVRATAETRVYIDYGSPGRIRALDDQDRFEQLRGYGYSSIANYAKVVAEKLDFDPASLNEGVVAGQPPRWAGVLWGDYDVAAVDGRLGDLGIDEQDDGDATRWNSGDDFEIDLANGPFTGIVSTSEFNNIRTADGSFAYSPARAGIDWVTDAGDETLADDDVVAPLATCLGDVVAATIADGQAAGVRATSDEVTEVICLEGDKGRVEKELAEGSTPSTRQPWSDILPGAKVVDAGDGLVRITATPKDTVGRSLRLIQTRDLTAFE